MKRKIIFGDIKARNTILYVQTILCKQIIAKYDDNEKRNRIQLINYEEYKLVKEWMITIQEELKRRAERSRKEY